MIPDGQPVLCTKCNRLPTPRDNGLLIYTRGEWLCSRCAFLSEEEDELDIRNRMYSGRSMVGSSMRMAGNEISGTSFTLKERERVREKAYKLGVKSADFRDYPTKRK